MSEALVPAPSDRAERLKILTQARDLKMARSPQRYVRGSTAQFYSWLAESKPARSAPKGPPVWICGDCHVGNLGPLADPAGRVDVQIRDLDQTVIGDPAHDLIRLGLSLAVAARDSDLPGVVTARIIEALVEGYGLGLDYTPSERDLEAPAPEAVKIVHRKALLRGWDDLAAERIDGPEPTIPIGKTFWPVSERERVAVEALVGGEDVRRLVLAISKRDEAATVMPIDVAYWKKGCSSLGKARFAVLLAVERGAERRYALLDLKAAQPSVAPAARGAQMPEGAAARVVAGARALSPNLGRRMLPADVLGRPMVVRELSPHDLKIEIGQFSRGEAVKAARYLAEVVGRAHGRQMDEVERRDWASTLSGRRKGALDAPSWLWSAVADLVGRHEAGYLEHCRRYALEAA